MELQELVRRVTKLQACVRGRQTRRRLRDLRAEYEEVVRQVEGEPAGRLRWEGRWLPRPVFSPEPRTRARGRRDGGGGGLGPVGEQPERDGGWKGPEPEAGPAPPQGLASERAEPGPPGQALPSQAAQLQRLRRHLAMEMLWLQQAIVSRKKYLLLRQTLDGPED